MFTNVLEYLERSVALYPDKEALGDEQSSVTYAQYVNKAKVIGTAIIDITKEAYNTPIAVLIDRNIESVVSFMGIVYSGNFYVPIDITMPKERVDLIIETLKPSLIIDARREQDSEYLHFSEIFEQYEADELPDEIDLKKSDYMLFTEANSMFEIKDKVKDITVITKIRN